jgi:hypothetical protein
MGFDLRGKNTFFFVRYIFLLFFSCSENYELREESLKLQDVFIDPKNQRVSGGLGFTRLLQVL